MQLASAYSDLPSTRDIAAWASVAVENEAQLCVRVVDEPESKSLNCTYRNQDKPTNVLSFPAEIDPHTAKLIGDLHPMLGDVVVCAPIVSREAHEQGKTFEHHFMHMVVHGVLHLRGFDHLNDADATLMEAQEIALLSQLDVPNPYE